MLAPIPLRPRSRASTSASAGSSRLRAALPAALLLSLAACATGGSIAETGGGGGTGARPGTGGEGGTGGGGGTTTQEGGAATTTTTSTPSVSFVESACPPGWFATGLDLENKLACQPLAPAVRDSINDGCALYLGWQDSCTACDLPPAKWGFTAPSGCQVGAGAGSTCTAPSLDGVDVQMIGIDFDGDVNTDDKIHLGLHCPAAGAPPAPGPCEAGSFAVSLGEGETECIPAAGPVIDHVRSRCNLYFGWRDACDGCTSAPDRWGIIGPTGCTLGAGDNSTCGTHALGGADVLMFGLSTGGDVDGNDKLYLALHCGEVQPAVTMTKGACPGGQLITALAADGTVTCESPAGIIAEYFDEHCTFYLGIRDQCNGCTEPPSKWGRVKNGFCTNDNGVDNTCTTTILGGTTLEMFGLNPDGDVDGNDKLYAGFRCD